MRLTDGPVVDEGRHAGDEALALLWGRGRIQLHTAILLHLTGLGAAIPLTEGHVHLRD